MQNNNEEIENDTNKQNNENYIDIKQEDIEIDIIDDVDVNDENKIKRRKPSSIFIKKTLYGTKNEKEMHKVRIYNYEKVNETDFSKKKNFDYERYGFMGVTRCPKSFYSQLYLLMKDSIKEMYRNFYLLPMCILIYLIIGMFIGIYFGTTGNKLEDAQNKTGLMFSLLLMLSLFSLTTLNLFGDDLIIAIREIQNGLYYKKTYFINKILFDIIIMKTLPVLFLLPCYFIANMKQDFINVYYFVIILLCFNIVNALYMSTIVCIFKKMDKSQLISAIVVIYGIMTCGLAKNTNNSPIYIKYSGYFGIWNYAFKALVFNELNERTFIIEPGNGLPNIPINGDEAMKRLGIYPENFDNYIKIMIMYIIFMFFVSLFSFKFYVKEKK